MFSSRKIQLFWNKILCCSFILLLNIIILNVSGCQTISNVRVSTEEISEDPDNEIVQIVMNNGTVLDVKNKGAKFYLKYKDLNNVIVYPKGIKDSSAVIELTDINSIIIEKGSESENAVLMIVAVAGGILLIYGIVLLVTLMNAVD